MRKRARTDLCGGRPAMVVPTATVEPPHPTADIILKTSSGQFRAVPFARSARARSRTVGACVQSAAPLSNWRQTPRPSPPLDTNCLPPQTRLRTMAAFPLAPLWESAIACSACGRTSVLRLTPFPNSQEILARQGHDIAARLGYTDRPSIRTTRSKQAAYRRLQELTDFVGNHLRGCPEG